MALLGMAFSPEYGESYYEIFGLGNYDNIVHFTHPGNVLALRLTTAIDIPLGKKQKNILRVALNSDIYSSKINGLHTDIRYLPVSLGFVKTLYKIKGKNPLKQYTPY
jgi:hypothetical protein